MHGTDRTGRTVVHHLFISDAPLPVVGILDALRIADDIVPGSQAHPYRIVMAVVVVGNGPGLAAVFKTALQTDFFLLVVLETADRHLAERVVPAGHLLSDRSVLIVGIFALDHRTGR